MYKILMDKILLLDINDTIDEVRPNSLLRPSIHWVSHPREWVSDLGKMLNDFSSKVTPIFWTAVWIEGQSWVAREFLSTKVIWFDGFDFIPDVWEYTNLRDRKIWISSPKSRYIQKVIDFTAWWVLEIIWFEDSLNSTDKIFAEHHKMITHVWITRDENLSDKVNEIKRLI